MQMQVAASAAEGAGAAEEEDDRSWCEMPSASRCPSDEEGFGTRTENSLQSYQSAGMRKRRAAIFGHEVAEIARARSLVHYDRQSAGRDHRGRKARPVEALDEHHDKEKVLINSQSIRGRDIMEKMRADEAKFWQNYLYLVEWAVVDSVKNPIVAKPPRP